MDGSDFAVPEAQNPHSGANTSLVCPTHRGSAWSRHFARPWFYSLVTGNHWGLHVSNGFAPHMHAEQRAAQRVNLRGVSTPFSGGSRSAATHATTKHHHPFAGGWFGMVLDGTVRCLSKESKSRSEFVSAAPVRSTHSRSHIPYSARAEPLEADSTRRHGVRGLHGQARLSSSHRVGYAVP
jgi:hypothetical protein